MINLISVDSLDCVKYLEDKFVLIGQVYGDLQIFKLLAIFTIFLNFFLLLLHVSHFCIYPI